MSDNEPRSDNKPCKIFDLKKEKKKNQLESTEEFELLGGKRKRKSRKSRKSRKLRKTKKYKKISKSRKKKTRKYKRKN
jgi:hypothetical protein